MSSERGMRRLAAIVACVILLGANSARADDRTFASLKVDRLAWKAEELIYGGRLQIRGALVVTANAIAGPGTVICDPVGCDYLFEFPLAIRGFVGDRQFPSWRTGWNLPSSPKRLLWRLTAN